MRGIPLMMISWLRNFIIVITITSSFIHSDDPCRFSHSKGVIDLTSVGRTDGTAAFPDISPPYGSNYKYSYNPCRPFSEGSSCTNVAVCQLSNDGYFSFTLGEQETATWSAGSGLGTYPTLSYSSGEKRASIQLVCSPDSSSIFEALGEGPIYNYKFILTHKCACWDGCTGPSPQQNCTINGSVYSSDKQIIQSFPFHVSINPSESAPTTLNYAIVNTNGQVTQLSLNNINSIPPGLFCLSQLQTLSLQDCDNLIIPSEIIRLAPSLKSFTVSKISKSLVLPPEFFNITSLTTVSIVHSRLKILSEDLIKLTQLSQLTLDQNQLLTLPAALGKMASLTYLSVNNNRRLSSLDILNTSSSLRTLRASNCVIDHLPINLKNLNTMEMDGNQLISLDGIETITTLSSDSFSFRNNKIKSISPISLRNIRKLRYFDLSNNLLTILPDSVYTINNLEILDIRNNDFDEKEREWIQGIFRITNTTVII